MSHDQDLAPTQEQAAHKTILIVEDDEGIGSFLNAAIAQETSHHILFAPNSKRALEIVQQVKVDLFLLDYLLTPINGIELYDQLHVYKDHEHTPAIIFTASLARIQPQIEQRNLIGLSKPVELDELLSTIEGLLAPPP